MDVSILNSRSIFYFTFNSEDFSEPRVDTAGIYRYCLLLLPLARWQALITTMSVKYLRCKLLPWQASRKQQDMHNIGKVPSIIIYHHRNYNSFRYDSYLIYQPRENPSQLAISKSVHVLFSRYSKYCCTFHTALASRQHAPRHKGKRKYLN